MPRPGHAGRHADHQRQHRAWATRPMWPATSPSLARAASPCRRMAFTAATSAAPAAPSAWGRRRRSAAASPPTTGTVTVAQAAHVFGSGQQHQRRGGRQLQRPTGRQCDHQRRRSRWRKTRSSPATWPAAPDWWTCNTAPRSPAASPAPATSSWRKAPRRCLASSPPRPAPSRWVPRCRSTACAAAAAVADELRGQGLRPDHATRLRAQRASGDHYELSLPSVSLSCPVGHRHRHRLRSQQQPLQQRGHGRQRHLRDAQHQRRVAGRGHGHVQQLGRCQQPNLSYPGAANGALATVTLSGGSSANPNKCCPNGSSCTVKNSCEHHLQHGPASPSRPVSTVPRPTSSTRWPAPLQTPITCGPCRPSPPNGVCQAALTGSQTIGVAYECNNPSSCATTSNTQMAVGGGTAIGFGNGLVSSSGSGFGAVTLNFDPQGNALFTLTYRDAGQTTLWSAGCRTRGSRRSTRSAAAPMPSTTKPAAFV